ncbi:MAG: SH3 domain-containing protein [Methanobrevibacter sp.]|nr:SH3 domain-containing protein [Methanobrevibacter sp.]
MKVDYKKVVATALSEVGYQGSSKSSKYSKYMDKYKFYNYPKDGAASWCAIFYDYCVLVNNDNQVDKTRTILCEPQVDNCGAGCTQKVAYYKSKGRYITDHSKATTGDEIFFKKSNGAVYHTGIVVDWDKKGFYVVEGNTDGNKVAKKFYAYHDPKIAGFGRPDWYKYEDEVAAPVKPSEPSGKFIVNTKTDPLRLRAYASLSAPVICLMKKGSEVTFIQDCGDFYKVKYKTMIGYAHKEYLKKA